MNRERMREKWEYTIRITQEAVFPVILLVFIGGVVVWPFSGRKGAICTALMLLLPGSIVCRTAFHKIFVGERGFYHQTGPGSGKYYLYSEIREAWISAGLVRNGEQDSCCNYITADGQTHKFPVFYKDLAGAARLVRRATEAGGGDTHPAREEPTAESRRTHAHGDYQITRRQDPLAGVMVSFILAADFIVLTAGCLADSSSPISSTICFGLLAAYSLGNFIFILVRRLCFKVYIGPEGFYFRTTPLNGKYYKYTDIKQCEETCDTYERRAGKGFGPRTTTYQYTFFFTDKSEKTRRFQFQKPMSGREVAVLQKRIEKAKAPSGPPGE